MTITFGRVEEPIGAAETHPAQHTANSTPIARDQYTPTAADFRPQLIMDLACKDFPIPVIGISGIRGSLQFLQMIQVTYQNTSSTTARGWGSRMAG
jgi:hypothetical protein